MQKLFKLRKANRNVREKYRLNIDISVVSQVIYVTKSVRSCGPKLYNSLPHQIKSAENLLKNDNNNNN